MKVISIINETEEMISSQKKNENK